VSLIGIAFTILLMLIVKLINVITGDYDGIFYKQERIGKNGKKFKMYKFRTMVKDADKKLEEVLENPKYRAEWNMNQKLKNDPRITKAGKILRKTSLDEVPQFINVFKGDMSLIGPRPLVEGELDNHNGNHKLYESVRPGITSWWACHGRNNVSYKERLNLEYYYIKNRSLWLDIKCIFLTIRAVIDKTGAK
jgi:undecaprenyl-phosphate galactose phosphotransferase